MTVTLAGMGGGTAATMTEELRWAMERARLIVGTQRLLDALPSGLAAATVAAVAPGEILRLLKTSDCEEALVLYSGDSGFYSGARGLLALLQEEHIPARVLPGLSSVQLLAARLGRPWQDWTCLLYTSKTCPAVHTAGKPGRNRAADGQNAGTARMLRTGISVPLRQTMYPGPFPQIRRKGAFFLPAFPQSNRRFPNP